MIEEPSARLERKGEYRRKYYESHLEVWRERGRESRKMHPERSKEYCRKYRERHPERAYESSRKWRLANLEKVRLMKREWGGEHREDIADRQRDYYQRNRQQVLDRKRNYDKVKESARKAVKWAVKTGKLQKPDACSWCGKKGRVVGHHPDYSKKLDVEWVCISCHKLHHEEERRCQG